MFFFQRAQIDEEILRGLISIVGIFLEQLANDALEFRRRAWIESREGRGLVRQNRGGDSGRTGALERPLPADHLVQQDADTE